MTVVWFTHRPQAGSFILLLLTVRGLLRPTFSSPLSRAQARSYSWILGQNPEHYTIQAIALRSLPKLQSLTKGYDHLAPFATYTVELKGKPLYVLVQGNYPNVESARRARDNFPRAINRPDRVWIRQFSKIQQLIREAEQGPQ